MNRKAPLIVVSAILVLVAGCGSTPPPQPVQEVQQPEPPQNQEVLKALSDLAEIKEELKQLRNAVEEIQFETENAKRRQQDLFQDLDRRMASVERNESLLNPQTEEPVDSQITVVDGDAGEQQSGEQDGEQTGGSVNQVVVSNSNNTTSTTASSSTGQIASTTSTVSGSVTLQEQEAYDQGFELLKQSRYEDAINQFQMMADTWPDSQLADDSYYWMSEARYVNREFEHALSGFRTVVSRYPDSQRVPEALLKVGYIQYDIGAYEEAADTFRDILARFPGHQVTVAAQTRLRRIENTIQ
jgi:tol-pal system protein YbgF